MKGPIAIAVSGGIDSLVAAYLLKKKGIETFGIHFRTGYEKPAPLGAMTLETYCRQVSLDLFVVDLSSSFRKEVVDYFCASYRGGKTPNPCLVCNSTIKFGALWEAAQKLGAAGLATGHYARVEKGDQGDYRLCKGLDGEKDQSYFLARLSQRQLARACFPLGGWAKVQVGALAEENNLQPITSGESQDVCFIHGASYVDFLKQNGDMDFRPGDIVDSRGRLLGTHDGLHQFTVGQRRGINCPASQPYYVVRIDIENNRLVVGVKDEVYSDSCNVTDINWIAPPPNAPLSLDVRVRYRHRAVAAMVTPDGPCAARVRFVEPQAAVTPGQGAVFYLGDEVLGGGWIK